MASSACYVSPQPEMNILDAVASVSTGLNLQLKDKQKEAIQRFCEGHDMFVSLPTAWVQKINDIWYISTGVR